MFKYPFKAANKFTRAWEDARGERAILLIHDVGLRLDWWGKNIREIAAHGFRVLCFDLPGHGFADKSTGSGHTLAGYAAFVRSFMDERRLERPILVGGGIGGQIAARVACDNPASIGGLVLCSPTGIIPFDDRVSSAYRGLLSDTTRDGAAARVQLMVADGSLIDAGMIEDDHLINASPGASESFGELATQLSSLLAAGLLGDQLAGVSLTLPTAIIWGALDEVIPATYAELTQRKLGPSTSLTVIDDAGHACFFEKPAPFNDAVVRFAQRVR